MALQTNIWSDGRSLYLTSCSLHEHSLCKNEGLYATYWVKGKLPANPETNPTFLILIDADFKKTGVDGIDYGSKIFFDNGDWKKQTLEWSESESKPFERVIDSTTIPVQELFETDRNFISHSIDLRKIGSPDKYRLIFSTYDQLPGNETSEVFDYSACCVM